MKRALAEARAASRKARWLLLALAAGPALALFWAAAGRLSHPRGDDVVLITVDTLRTDHVSAYGTKALTPAMDRLASQGVLFERASTNIPRTTAALATLFTGRDPQQHGVRFLEQPLPEGERTLAQALSLRGFRTTGLAAGGPLGPRTRLDRGFASYRCYVDLKAALLTLRALPWLFLNIPRRTFLWIHYFDPHFGYNPPWPYGRQEGEPPGFRVYQDIRERRLTFGRLHFAPPMTEQEHSYLRALYRGEVEYTDAAVGVLQRALRLRDALTGGRTLVVLTADHGESLGEHGCWYEHGEYLYESDVRIPLVICWPGRLRPGARTSVETGLTDLAPTMLELLRLPPLEGAGGRSVSAALGGEGLAGSPIFVESGESFFTENPRRPLGGVEGRWRAVVSGGWKLILIPHPEGAELELYDLAADPAESRNLAAGLPTRAAPMREALETWMRAQSGRPPAPAAGMDEETRKRLRSLGYLD